MGRKQSGLRQHLYSGAAGLILILLAACQLLVPMPAEQESRPSLKQVQSLFTKGDFQAALEKCRQVLAFFPDTPPGDGALFYQGLIYSHQANPQKNYQKALTLFNRLEKEFPESPRTGEARVLAGVLKSMEAMAARQKSARRQQEELRQGEALMRQGDFDGAEQASRKLLERFPHTPPGDAALFNLGLIYIHYANPKKDIGKARSVFTELATEFPASPRGEEARIWAGILETMERAKQVDLEIEEKKKALRR